ncbi:unnamed protein product [Amaranthus hypochondriacus]
MNFPKNGLSTSFISLMKVLGAPVNPNDITNHSYNPYLVLKAVFHSSPSLIRIWWYPLLRSILLNHWDLDSSSSMSSIRGIGNLYLTVILFTLRLSTHICHVPSFLGTSRVGTTQGLMLSLT